MAKKILFGILLYLMIILPVKIKDILAQSNQAGTLKGHVISSDEKYGLPFANVLVVGTNNGVATDSDGFYVLRNIKAGKQKIRVSYVGYEVIVQEIEIVANKTTEANYILKLASAETQEVLITAQAKGQLSAINQQINSNTIKNVVSPERLQENPDANAAEAIGRLPGVSLMRSGGEGRNIVIRGMKSDYSTVTLNGVQLSSTDANNRSTSISGISQFLLQFVEVNKAITPDMDGNSVAGSINLKLSKAPDSLHFSLLSRGGYNNLNDDWSNYKFVGDISSRFFNRKLGVRFDVDVEKVNRSTQTMSANYYVASNITGGLENEQVLLHSVGLNDITNIPERLSGTLVLDYSISPTSKVIFYNLFSKNDGQYLNINKFNALQFATFTTNINQNNGNRLLFSSSIKVEHALSWINIDYGMAFAQTHNYTEGKSWSLLPYGIPSLPVTNETRSLTPQQALSTFVDEDNAELGKIVLYSMGISKDDLFQKNITPYFDLKVPFNIGNSISGYVKGGGKYNYLTRKRNYLGANQNPTSISTFGILADSEIDWVTLNSANMVNSSNLVDHQVTNFYDGVYNFGWYPSLDRLNQLWDWWDNLSNDVLAQGNQAVVDKFGASTNIGFTPDILNSSINDQDIDEKYIGIYLMSEINFSNFLMFLPGARYEKVTNNLSGHSVLSTASTYGLSIPGTTVDATHNDEFLLPMIHLRIKPNDWMHVHLSYTQALKRPDYVALIPNQYINNIFGSYVYRTGNPNLKPELWTNYDLQLVLYTNKIGMFALNGFYKKVKNKIWHRTYNRLPDDPPIPGFEDNAIVSVTETVNHEYPGYVKGIEFEWQTRFWYLPEPFNHFLLNANFTVLKSETQYPTTRVFTTYEIGDDGRPTVSMNRIDSTITNRLEYQPNNIANISLGFNYKGLNAWLSFQYSGETLTGWSNQKELIPFQISFSRWDFQIAQKLPIEGMDLLFNVANINNYNSSSKLSGDSRPSYLESYGWTADLGLRYIF